MPLLGAFNPYPGSPNAIALAPGEQYVLGPEAGLYQIALSPYHVMQYRDPISNQWRSAGNSGEAASVNTIWSDGVNVRLANQTGCAVGALLTAAGSGYTSAPTVAPSAGGSKWNALVGGAVNTSVTVSAGGQNYTYPPTCVIDAPPRGGIQATATATLSSGAVSAVTIIDQGAGYVTTPNISFVNDPREIENPLLTTGYGAKATLALTGAQTVTGLICTDPGQGGLTSIPTLAFSGGGGSSAAATVLMCWTATAYTTSGGTGYPNAFEISGLDAFPTTSPAYTNPTSQKNLVYTRRASIKAIASGGVPTATGQVVYDGGIYTSQPTALAVTGGLITAAATLALTMGGVSGVSLVMRVG